MKKDFTIVERIPFTVMSFGNKCCGSREVTSKRKVPITLDTCEYDVERFKECVVGGIASAKPSDYFVGGAVFGKNCSTWASTLIERCKESSKR